MNSVKVLKYSFYALAAMGGLVFICVVMLIKGQRGGREWETCRRELEAKGEHLDWREFVPPPVRDEDNFAATPLLAPLMEFAKSGDTNVLARLNGLFVWAGYMRGGD